MSSNDEQRPSWDQYYKELAIVTAKGVHAKITCGLSIS